MLINNGLKGKVLIPESSEKTNRLAIFNEAINEI
jgi:hypothetical protein